MSAQGEFDDYPTVTKAVDDLFAAKRLETELNKFPNTAKALEKVLARKRKSVDTVQRAEKVKKEEKKKEEKKEEEKKKEGEEEEGKKKKEEKKEASDSIFPLRVLSAKDSQVFSPALCLMICKSCHKEMKMASSAVEIPGSKTLVTIALCAACVRVNRGIHRVVRRESRSAYQTWS